MEFNLCISNVPLESSERRSVAGVSGKLEAKPGPVSFSCWSQEQYSIGLVVVHSVWGPHSLGPCRRMQESRDKKPHRAPRKPRAQKNQATKRWILFFIQSDKLSFFYFGVLFGSHFVFFLDIFSIDYFLSIHYFPSTSLEFIYCVYIVLVAILESQHI